MKEFIKYVPCFVDTTFRISNSALKIDERLDVCVKVYQDCQMLTDFSQIGNAPAIVFSDYQNDNMRVAKAKLDSTPGVDLVKILLKRGWRYYVGFHITSMRIDTALRLYDYNSKHPGGIPDSTCGVDDLLDCDWHGGVTYFDVKGTGTDLYFTVGCDFQHYCDDGAKHTALSVANEAIGTARKIEKLLSKLDYKLADEVPF